LNLSAVRLLVFARHASFAFPVPSVTHFGGVWTPSFAANHADFGEIQEGARTLRLALSSFEVRHPSDLDMVFKEAAARTGGVAVLSGPMIFTHREQVVAIAARHKIPAIYYDSELRKFRWLGFLWSEHS
jgi:putative ABC transport system substrate-binding protein